MAVTQRAAGANMSVDVAAGAVVIAGTDSANQGKYVGKLTAPVNVAIAAAPGAGLTRIDLVYARVFDTAAIGGTLDELTVEKPLTGTAVASGPVPPALPASSEALAQIAVAAGTASITNALITDRRRQALLAQQSFMLAGQFFPTTDAGGRFNVTLPAGGKLVAALAASAWAPNGAAPLVQWDANASPVGGSFAQFVAYNLAGSPILNASVGVAYHIVYTF
jgi:hypothetical protein